MSQSPVRRSAATRSDVARLAGVSPAVVSYVLNDSWRPVAAPTRDRVLDAIRILDYRPNAIARALKGHTTKTFGLMLPASSNPYFAELAQAIGDVAHDAGYAVLVSSTYSDEQREGELLAALIDRQVDGIIGSPVNRHRLEDAPVPVVFLESPRPVPRHMTITTDFDAGGRIATEHLLWHGATPVGAILGDDGQYSTIHRQLGWAAALHDAGLDEGPVARAEFSSQGGYRAAMELLSRRTRPASIFCSSDLQAIGALCAAFELGIEVPGDLAIVSFDGTRMGDFSCPPLTAVVQPIAEIAATAIAAFARAEDPEHIILQPSLRLRRSCGCPTVRAS